MILAGYVMLNMQTYFTAGVKEVRAWTIPVGATAPKAAGKIHTDFEKGFIRAQTIAFEDLITNKGEQGEKEAGKISSPAVFYRALRAISETMTRHNDFAVRNLYDMGLYYFGYSEAGFNAHTISVVKLTKERVSQAICGSFCCSRIRRSEDINALLRIRR